MGYFGTFTFARGTWSGDVGSEPSLTIEIHDSDIATIDYRAPRSGVGRCYLGTQPREYFEDPDASDLIDVDSEARRLGEWAAEALGSPVDAALIRPLLAEEGVDPPDDFVEETVHRLCEVLGLPVPAAISADG